jgi:predicted SnoaL-like aldol condensation-catalyzing enzyme
VSDPQANKQSAIDFYELMFNDNEPREATERYTGADYR